MNHSDSLLLEILTLLPDKAFVLTETGRYAMTLGGADTRYYHSGSLLLGLTLHDIMPVPKADGFLQEIRQALASDCPRSLHYSLKESDIPALDGTPGPREELWFEASIQPLSSLIDGERTVLWVARNITESHQLRLELQQQAELDELTGIFNRRKLMHILHSHFSGFQRYRRPFSLIIFDVDHFKTVNDRFGHLIGDEVLRRIAGHCGAGLREQDTLCRYGGEEFAVVLPHTSGTEAIPLADRLRDSIARLDLAACTGADCTLTISAGVSACLSSDKDVETLLQRADEALYQAKALGRDRVVAQL
ncbi:MAG: GGDEF domain-containing protein [Haliea sp.]|uniref:GGDEF domain-containing protein n=1 Tax=Haliea sp. TaxID=1932666 RepID=UPI0032EC38C6